VKATMRRRRPGRHHSMIPCDRCMPCIEEQARGLALQLATCPSRTRRHTQARLEPCACSS
jgi:hypothetical protein